MPVRHIMINMTVRHVMINMIALACCSAHVIMKEDVTLTVNSQYEECV